MKKPLKVVGIMNGTSLDGVDLVLCQISPPKQKTPLKIQLLDFASYAFPEKLRTQLRLASINKLTSWDLARAHHDLGRFYVEALQSISKKQKWKMDLIGLHGQTIFHQPPHATFQIGETSYLATTFQIPVISDFRTNDLALGGQGAPLASQFHFHAFASTNPKQNIALHNLGGISNLTLIGKSGVKCAFDTGPANMLMDLLVQKLTAGKKLFDDKGEWARTGKVHEEKLEKLLSHPFLSKSPPKSCGKEEFGSPEYIQEFLTHTAGLRDEDRIATATEFTAISIAKAYTDFCKPKPTQIILCGGGAKNLFLKQRLQYHMQKVQILTTMDFGWPVETIEGGAFALLASMRWWRIPANLPKTTGARKACLLGKITEAF